MGGTAPLVGTYEGRRAGSSKRCVIADTCSGRVRIAAQKSLWVWTTTFCALSVEPLSFPVTSTAPPTAMNCDGTMWAPRLTIEVPALMATW